MTATTSVTASPSSMSTQVLELSFGNKELVRRIKASNVFLVGAGGIGCEAIKGLLLSGFERITVIDLDTIDVSNLNRQFLYNKSHVGKSKAEVAAAVSVERFAHRDPATGEPISVVKPLHDSVLKPNYNKEFYRQFTFVINALDNNTTRVHVNRMCLAAGVPYVESASTGYAGNIKLIKSGVTRCYECDTPTKDENTYASCTIRNTPSQPIHCIVWAKHLFAQLFGQSDEDISPDVNDPKLLSVEGASGEAIPNGDAEKPTTESENVDSSVAEVATSQTTRQYVESTGYDPKALFEKIFYKDILYLKTMENLWTTRTAPRELIYDKVASGEATFEDGSNGTTNGNSDLTSTSGPTNSVIRAQKSWSMAECFDVFRSSLAKLKDRLPSEPILEWDKDDDDIVEFVASVSNFRSYCFSIPRKSKFEVKSLAGNIIPAISSTNTIIGGYIILQTMNLLKSLLPERFGNNDGTEAPKLTAEQLESEATALKANCFWGYITNKGSKNIKKTYIEEDLIGPKADCMACSKETKEIIVALPLSKTTLGDFIDQIVKKKFKTIAPDVNVFGLNKMLYAADDEEDMDESVRGKLLSAYSFMVDNVTLLLDDLEQDFHVRLLLRDMEFDPENNDGDFYKVLNQDELDAFSEDVKNAEKKKAEAAENAPAPTTSKAATSDEPIDIDDDDFILLEDEAEQSKTIEPNDEDFELIEMSELNDMEVEVKKAANKRPIEEDADGVVLLEDGDEENGVVNGNGTNNGKNNTNSPAKRIRTN